MRPLTKRLLVILFPVALTLPPASVLLPITPVEIENRRLEVPTISIDRLTDPRLYQEVFAYVRDASPMRVWLVKIGTGLDYWVFDDSPNPTRVFKGRENWLFFRDTVDEACAVPPSIVVRNLKDFVSRMEQDTPLVLLTVAPSKFVIHPEMLTDAQRELAKCGLEASRELQELLAASDLRNYVDGWQLFRNLKDEGVQPYFRTDTHFNFEGSIPWIETIVPLMGGTVDSSDIRDIGHVDFVGNLMQFLALDYPERVRKQLVDRRLPTEPIEGDLFSTRRYRPTVPPTTSVIEGKVVAIGDSFIRLPEPSLVQFFADITVMDWGDPESVGDFLNEARLADAVLIEISELDVWDTFEDSSLLMAYEAQIDRP